jgi:hypothetical protein
MVWKLQTQNQNSGDQAEKQFSRYCKKSRCPFSVGLLCISKSESEYGHLA